MIAAHTPHVPTTTAPVGILDSWKPRIARINVVSTDWLRQTLCGARGHAMLLHFESKRLSLQCMSCGRTTPGWTIQDRG